MPGLFISVQPAKALRLELDEGALAKDDEGCIAQRQRLAQQREERRGNVHWQCLLCWRQGANCIVPVNLVWQSRSRSQGCQYLVCDDTAAHR